VADVVAALARDAERVLDALRIGAVGLAVPVVVDLVQAGLPRLRRARVAGELDADRPGRASGDDGRLPFADDV